MEPYPLKKLSIYKVKKDFTSDRGFVNAYQFQKRQVLQFQEAISNLHDMIEIIQFRDFNTSEVLIWQTRVENLYDSWRDYLEPLQPGG